MLVFNIRLQTSEQSCCLCCCKKAFSYTAFTTGTDFPNGVSAALAAPSSQSFAPKWLADWQNGQRSVQKTEQIRCTLQ